MEKIEWLEKKAKYAEYDSKSFCPYCSAQGVFEIRYTESQHDPEQGYCPTCGALYRWPIMYTDSIHFEERGGFILSIDESEATQVLKNTQQTDLW